MAEGAYVPSVLQNRSRSKNMLGELSDPALPVPREVRDLRRPTIDSSQHMYISYPVEGEDDVDLFPNR
jgi:hypothetical protein